MRIKRNKEKHIVKSWSKAKGYSARALISCVLLFNIFFVESIFSQASVTTVGIQYKPIFGSDLAGSGTQTSIEGNLKMDLTLERGNSFGLIIRKGITDNLSFETGINSVTRRYQLDFDDLDSSFSKTLNFKYASYEIPVQGLVYIRLGENSWINSSLGFSINAYPRDVGTTGEGLSQRTFRDKKFQMAFVANIGYEYRTKKSGYWYLGGSLYNPFNSIGHTVGYYQSNTGNENVLIDVNGNYLTLDLRYFFHERPER